MTTTSTSASQLVEQRIGLATTTYFRNDFSELLERLSAGNIHQFTEMLAQSDEFSRPWQSVIQSLAIGETYFFRDETHFRLLREKILPEIIATQRSRGEHHLNIWSIGCATGEEPYSIAMLLHDMLPDYENWSLKLIGTDINAHALEMARQGIYRQWSFRQTDKRIERFFDRVPDGLRVKPEIRRMVTFRQGNVLKTPPLPQFDIVLCRNVMLYFTPDRVKQMERLLHDVLFEQGWLFLGQSEGLKHGREGWVTHIFPGAPIYQKMASPNGVEKHNGLPVTHDYVKTKTRPENRPTVEAPQVKKAPETLEEDSTTDYDRAIKALQEDRIEDARSMLKTIIQHQANNASAHVLMAVSYANTGKSADAHHHLDVALRIEPLLADGHYLRGLMHFESGNIEAAKKSFQHTLYCQRHHPLASFTLGILVAQDGDIPRAVRHWENARRAIMPLSPDSPLSDLSDMTAGQLDNMIDEQLAGWE